MALEFAPNGITIRATQPKEFYEGNQRHMLNGEEYYVALSRDDLFDTLYKNSHLVPEDASHMVTTFVRDMDRVFYGKNRFNCDISSWDTSNVFSMSQMFYMAHDFNQDISAWDTSNVQWMDNMFCYAISFNQDLSKWNIRSVKDMECMFDFAWSFTYDIETAWKPIMREDCRVDRLTAETAFEYYKQRKAPTIKGASAIKDELMEVAWEPSRAMDWCMDDDAKATFLYIC